MSLIGPLAHLVEHLICNEGVAGSSPVRSTRKNVSDVFSFWNVNKQNVLLMSGREKLFVMVKLLNHRKAILVM